MKDYASFFRQRLMACFNRRRRYTVGSEERAHCVAEARMFLDSYRAEMGRVRKLTSLAEPVSKQD